MEKVKEKQRREDQPRRWDLLEYAAKDFGKLGRGGAQTKVNLGRAGRCSGMGMDEMMMGRDGKVIQTMVEWEKGVAA